MSITNTEITRIRIKFGKRESLRFIGHLDLQRIWERTLRRSELPLRYSQGFRPRARLNLASALPLGYLSNEELLDFWLEVPLPLKDILLKLKNAAPSGLIILSAQVIDQHEESLQERVSASEFEVTFYDLQPLSTLETKVAQFLQQDSIPRSRRNKTYDLRHLVEDLQVSTLASGSAGLWMQLKAQPGATGRPDDVMDELGFGLSDYLVQRTKIILK